MVEHVAIMLREVVSKYPDRIATRIRLNNKWVTQTYAEFLNRINAIANGLIEVDIKKGDRVALFSNNCPEWSEADFAIMSARAITVPIYQTSTVDQITHILRDSGAKCIFVNGESEAKRVLEALPNLTELTTIVSFNSYTGIPEQVITLDNFMKFGNYQKVDLRIKSGLREEISSISYTSGTTGNPKGVMTAHKALISQIEALNDFFNITPEDHSLAFLPLSHALERSWSIIVFSHGCMNTYVTNARDVADQLILAKPTMMASVPKLYEKVYQTALEKVAKSKAKRAIFKWAIRVGGRLQHAYRKGKTPSVFWLAQFPLADKLVFSNVRDALGGKKTVLACGGAPLRQEVEEFFSSVGMLVCQGYGLTEASPLVSFNSPKGFKFGTCGQVIKGGKIRIGKDGEILYQGPNLMKGYWKDPKSTAEVLKDGWLHTGDVGYVDTDGYLVITDRLKDIIVTLGGKNVAPQPIEGLVLADPLFEHAVILGDNRPCLTLLVKPSFTHVQEMAENLHWPGGMPEWLQHPEFIAEIKNRIKKITAKLPSQEQIRDTQVLADEFTTDNGLLTPTLKVKRKEAEKRFKHLVDEMYVRIANQAKKFRASQAAESESAKRDDENKTEKDK